MYICTCIPIYIYMSYHIYIYIYTYVVSLYKLQCYTTCMFAVSLPISSSANRRRRRAQGAAMAAPWAIFVCINVRRGVPF